ncbi:retrovirus-related pol polyprotein from transposon TNT 1-94 [Tanacetum coccineum]|uniref:Retrovirus-related pol polyprotein from transposon TNT 1-94 n=1 Tax=Tanacetum coccineum TaxID=301880 RepID=A0ABQ4Y791_9ASTR
MVEEGTSLKKDFKQKENKYFEEFLDMKALKEKVEDKLYKQDQFLQIVHMLCKPKSYYDEQNKVAIGYKNPLCLTRAKQVQPALYNGHEIIKTNHVPAIVPNSKDTLKIAEFNRKKMNDKMKDPECVKKKDLIKMKTEALKEQTTTSRPIKALTMYPSNTPATIVPRVLPTKSQVKINIFALTQLFSEFGKTCKKRITQNVVNRKHDEIEQKYLLIANDNLIVDCLSKKVFYIATNSELTVSRFTEMHAAHTVVQAHCLELEAELSKLLDQVQKDDHTELVKCFSNLEVNHLNLQLKYQNLKESFVNNTSPPARDAPDFDSVFVIEKMKASIQGKDSAIKKLRIQISQLNETRSETDRTLDFRALDFQITQLTDKVTVLQEQNELFKTENAKIKHHYKESYDSIKIMLLAIGRYVIDVEPIPPRNRNNREVHLDYLKHLKESVKTLREIIKEAKVERPLENSLAFAFLCTKHSQELLEYVTDTCPKDFNQRDKNHVATPLTRKKQVTFEDQCETSNSNTHKHVEQLNIQKTNVLMPPSTGVNSCTDASGSHPRSNTKKNSFLLAKSVNKKKVEEHPRTNKSSLKTTNRIDSSISSKRTVINSNSHSVCKTCNKCLIFANHDMCVVNYLHSVNASPFVKNVMRKVQQVWKPKQVKPVWKPTSKVLTNVGYQWMPTGRTFTLGEQCPLTRLTKSKVVPAKQMENVRDCSRLRNFKKKFIGTVRFSNDHFGAIMGYGEYMIGDSVISRVYYVEGLGHNLFSVEQFYDSDLEVAFRKHSCYVQNTDGVELIKGSCGSNLYTISVEDMMKSSPICLLSKATKNKSWLWHRRLNHLKFNTINDLNGVVERQNRTLVEAARTMLIFSKAPMFLWAEAVATACYTQNRSLIHTRHNKTPYELVHDKKPDLTFFRVFGALCYPTNDSEDLGKLQPTADIGIFVGYAPSRKGYRIYNKRTRRIMETIHVQFDELSEPMAPVQLSTGPAPTFLMPGLDI